MNERYYFEGVFYDTQNQLFEASARYIHSRVSNVTARRIIDKMVTDIVFNINVTENSKYLTNGEFEEICSNIIEEFVGQYRQKLTEKYEL